MLSATTISKKADELLSHYHAHSLEDLAEQMGIIVIRRNFPSLLGMYVYRWETPGIFLSRSMDSDLERMVLAHELGHDQLHRDLAGDGLLDYGIHKYVATTEYEANAFASHLLLSTESFLSYAQQGLTMEEIAREFRVHLALVEIKAKELQRMGYPISLSLEPKPCFLRDIPRQEEWEAL